MSQIEKRGLVNDAVDGTKLKFLNAQKFRVRNNANNADVDLFDFNASNEWVFYQLPKFGGSNVATESHVASQVSNYIPLTEKGSAGGVAPLGLDNLIPPIYLPSYVDDVLEFADLASFPVTGEGSKIYVDVSTNLQYRWGGTSYHKVSPSDVNSVNGKTGIVALTTDDVPEGATNLYWTQSRFNSSFSTKTTDDLSEGLTNKYFTDQRAKDAVVVNSTSGNETDKAPSVSAVKALVASASTVATPFTVTLDAGMISQGYVALPEIADRIISVVPKGFPPQHPVDDFTTANVGLVTHLIFAGDMLLLQAGDKICIVYAV